MASLPDDPLTHSHVFLGESHDRNARRTLWVVLLTAAMMVGEVVAGWITGSMALLADGVHMATHAGALGLSVAAYAFARRHAEDRRFTFGTGKVGDLAGFASALILGVVALGIAAESVLRLLRPVEVDFGPATVVAVLGLAVNLGSALLLAGGHHGHARHHDHHHHHDHDPDHPHHRDHGHSHHRHAAHGQDHNLRAAYLHVLADALTSVLAIAALLAGSVLGWAWLDPLVGLLGAAVIARWSLSLLRDTAGVLLDATEPATAAAIRERIEGTDATLNDLHVWRVGPGARAAIVSVTGPPEVAEVRARLADLGLAHLTVERR